MRIKTILGPFVMASAVFSYFLLLSIITNIIYFIFCKTITTPTSILPINKLSITLLFLSILISWPIASKLFFKIANKVKIVGA